MAKRGERRPYLVRFQRANGVKGSDTFRTLELAQDYAAMIERNAATRDTTVTVEIVDRTA